MSALRADATWSACVWRLDDRMRVRGTAHRGGTCPPSDFTGRVSKSCGRPGRIGDSGPRQQIPIVARSIEAAPAAASARREEVAVNRSYVHDRAVHGAAYFCAGEIVANHAGGLIRQPRPEG